MPRFAPTPAIDGPSRSLSPLAALAEIAAAVASGRAAERVLPEALELVRLALGAAECSLWRPTVGGAEEGAGALAGLVPGAPGLTAVTVRHAGEDLAVLSLRPTRPLVAEERLALRAAADLLASLLARAAPVPPPPRPADAGGDPRNRLVEKTLDSIPLGIYVIDRDYRIQLWNRKRETGMQGVSREEAVGRTIFEILHRQPAAALRREFEEVFASGCIRQHEVDTLAGGELRIYRLSKIPMRLDDGEVTHVITVGEDITERRAALARVAQSEKLAAVGQLAAGVMHEINNPLATIGVCAEGVAMRLESQALEAHVRDSVDDYLTIVRDEVERCRRIVGRLLDFSRPRALSKAPLDLNGVVERTLQLLAHHDRFRRVRLERDLERGAELAVVGNDEALIQVFMALLLNAADAVEPGGRVAVRTRRDADSGAVVAEVVDDGHGIAREHMARLFDPFFTTKTPGRGTGLGLSISYGIVTDHGGQLEVDSVAGHGSTFRVRLPGAATSA